MGSGYDWLKLGHVLGVIVWLGGSLTLTVLGSMLARADDPTVLKAFNKQASFYGPVVVGPASLLTLLTGLGLAGIGGFFRSPFVHIGFLGIVIHFIFGPVLMRRSALRIDAILSAPQLDKAALRQASGRLTLLSLIYLTVMLVVVVTMVLKI